MHARALRSFLRHRDGQGIIKSPLVEQEHYVLRVLRERFQINCVSEVNWDNHVEMTRHPLVLLACIFPGMLSFLSTGEMGPKVDWGLPSRAAADVKLQILRQRREVRLAWGTERPLPEVLPRRFGQEEDWHHLWHGSITTDGQMFSLLLYNSAQPTMRRSPTAQRLKLTPRPYAYDNILSVSSG